MQMRSLGRTGLEVSALGFGCGPLGGHFGPYDKATSVAAVRHAIDSGINFFDTSPFYSRSEEVLGEALAGGYREKIILCTKAGRNGPKDFDFSPKAMLASLERSLTRLGTDHVDVWFAHDIEFAMDFKTVFTETAEAMRQAQRAGKCRFIGMTGYPPGLLARAIEDARVDVVLNYCHFSLTNSQLLSRLLPVAEKYGAGLVNASALMMGLFSRKGPPAWHSAPQPFKDACRAVVELCQRRGADAEVLALQYVLQQPRVPCTLVGMCSLAEVDTNLRALDMTINAGLLTDAQKLLAPFADIEWGSGNWPKGQ
jgi:L-galactose dehydrogenase